MKNFPLMRLRMLAQFLALCATALLAGCGGGSGGASDPPVTTQTASTQTTDASTTSRTPPPPPQPSDSTASASPKPETPEPFPHTLPKEKTPRVFTVQQIEAQQNAARDFRYSPEYNPHGWRLHGGEPLYSLKSNHLKDINAHWAHARGATGTGEIVAVSDSTIDINHRELRGKVTHVAGTFDLARSWFGGSRNGRPAHGTAVATLIAAERDGKRNMRKDNMQGVAFGAGLAFRHAVFFGNPGATPGNPEGKYRFDLNLASEEFDKKNVKYMVNLGHAREHGAAITNFSFGFDDGHPINGYSGETILEKLDHTAAHLAQAETDDANKIIVVFAAGNRGHDAPSLLSGLGVHFPELQSHVLTVVATGEFGEIKTKDPHISSDWSSNRCGIAKNFCLAAPGYDLVVGGEKRGYLIGGTSYAAPLVSGSLALLRQYFRDEDGTRQLGNTELVSRLLATAYSGKKHPITGKDYSNSDIYGHGLLDLDAATKPYGMLMTSLQSDPNARPFDASAFSLSGNAFGGAMRDALGGVKIAAFDELDAPFFFPLADGVSHAPQISAGHSDTLHEHELSLGGVSSNASLALSLAAGELSAARIRRGNLWFSYGHHGGREAGLYFGENKNPPENFGMNFAAENSAENVANPARHFRAPLAFASPYLSLVRDGPGLGWSQPLRSGARLGFSLMHGAPQFDHFANPGGARGLGALFDFRPNNTSLSLQAGAVREADGFLGARAQGNFGEISADTAFAGIGGDWAAMQNWRLLASAYLGHTKADTGDGMLRAADDIVSSAFSLGLARASLARRGDWLGLRLSQPLRAESGAAHLRIPAGRTKYREVIHRQHKLELTPSGRNLQVEAEYRIPFAGGNLRAGLGFDRHANHDRARDLETFLRLGFERRF